MKTQDDEMIATAQDQEPIVWNTYVSWNQFVWLYLVSLFTAMRGVLLWQAAVPGWSVWVLGAGALVAAAVFLRYWVRYAATSTRLLIMNAFTGREIETILLDTVGEATVKQGPIAWVLGIGTIVFTSTHGDEVMQFRGVGDPESTLQQIQAVRRRRIFPSS